MDMTRDRAREISDGLHLSASSTADEWGDRIREDVLFHARHNLASAALTTHVSQLVQAYAVLHSTPIVEERDRLRAAISALDRAGALYADFGEVTTCRLCHMGGDQADHVSHALDCILYREL
jgi:hypothetical protein